MYKKELEELERQEAQELLSKKNEYENSIPELAQSYIEEGMKYIYPELKEEWTKYVNSTLNSELVKGKGLNEVLSVIKYIKETKDIEGVYDAVDLSKYSGAIYGTLLRGIYFFSDKGPEFYKFDMEKSGHSLNEKSLEQINKIIERNNELEKVQKNNKGNR